MLFKSYEDFHLLLTTDGWTDRRTQSHMFPFIKCVQGSYASGKCQVFFQGQGILCCVSEKYEGNVREFCNFQFVSNDEKQKLLGQFS